MSEENQIINRVANSPLITIDMAEYIDHTPRVVFDIKDNLFQGIILKEKDFREFIKNHDWSFYEDKYVAITCTTDAIIPAWSYMLLITKIQPYAKAVFLTDESGLEKEIIKIRLDEMLKPIQFQEKKIVIKGCAEIGETEFAFAELTKRLLPYVDSIMYGEPCSTVPVYKRRKS